MLNKETLFGQESPSEFDSIASVPSSFLPGEDERANPVMDSVKDMGKSLLGSKYFYIGLGCFLLYFFFKKNNKRQ
jgi:hypothetical protein